jgi:DASH complex subunit DAD1
MHSVLTNLNRLNRAMEPILVIGGEFSSVEALWSTFEGVMGNGVNNGKEEEMEKKDGSDASEGAQES